jgi:DNA-binding transcriptional ArsR family regulator
MVDISLHFAHNNQIATLISFCRLYTLMKTPLSQELIVACCIYDLQSKSEKIWLLKIQEHLSGKVGKAKVRSAIDTLFDRGLIKAEYGETDKKRAGRLYRIPEEAISVIAELHKRYYADLFVKLEPEKE